MCLTITDLPKNQRSAMIVKCYKHLTLNDDLEPITPYRGVRVPKTGLLVPSSKRIQVDDFHCIKRTLVSHNTFVRCKTQGDIEKTGIQRTTAIEGGAIHAYEKHQKTLYLSYAFRVVAYQGGFLDCIANRQQLACLALYIPSCDRNKSRREALTRILEKATSRKLGATPKDVSLVLNYFPSLGHLFPGVEACA